MIFHLPGKENPRNRERPCAIPQKGQHKAFSIVIIEQAVPENPPADKALYNLIIQKFRCAVDILAKCLQAEIHARSLLVHRTADRRFLPSSTF